MLAHYSSILNGVELNGSFYRTPPATTLERWAAETPAGFRFCLKAQRGLSYSAAGFDKEGLARVIGARMACLDERLGPLLVQFPPTANPDPGLLDRVLTALGCGRPSSSATMPGSTRGSTRCCAFMERRWWSPTKRSGRGRRASRRGRSPTTACAGTTTERLSGGGARSFVRSRPPGTSSTSTFDTSKKGPGELASCLSRA